MELTFFCENVIKCNDQKDKWNKRDSSEIDRDIIHPYLCKSICMYINLIKDKDDIPGHGEKLVIQQFLSVYCIPK